MSPVWPCDGAYADHSPQPSVVHVAVRRGAEQHAGKPRDVNQHVLAMTDGCALLVCIYAFKLPSAVHIPNDKRWNKRDPEHFHLRGVLPQPSPGP